MTFAPELLLIDVSAADWSHPVLPVSSEDGHGEQRSGVGLCGDGPYLERRAQVHTRVVQEGMYVYMYLCIYVCMHVCTLCLIQYSTLIYIER